MGIVVHVAAANADGVDGDLHVIRPDGKGEIDIAKGEHALLFENQGLHGKCPVINCSCAGTHC